MIYQIIFLLSALIGGFFFAYFGVISGAARVSQIMVIAVALYSYIPYVRARGYVGFLVIIALGLFAYIAEYVGVHTCFPYGCFVYTDVMGYKLLDTVPWTVFFAWAPLVLGVGTLVKKHISSLWIQIPIGALMLVMIDLVLDPGAVMMGLWQFTNIGWWYTIPASNFFGRLISGILGLSIFLLLEKKKNQIPHVCTMSMMWHVLFWTTVVLMKGLWGAGIVGVCLLVGYGIFWYKKKGA